MSPQRRYAVMGALGTFLFCVGVGLLVRRCELARMAHVSVVEKDAMIWRSFYASRSR